MTAAAAPAPKAETPTNINSPTSPPAYQRDSVIIYVPSAGPANADKGWGDAAATIAIAWAWPLALIMVFLIFRKPMTRFIDRLRSFKGAGMEATTEAMINEELPTREPLGGGPKVDPENSPIATIVLAWVVLEKAARDAVVRANLRSLIESRGAAYSTVIRNVEALDRERLIAPEVRPLVVDLAKIRNQAIHRPEEPISQEALNKFYANAEFATARLNAVAPKVD